MQVYTDSYSRQEVLGALLSHVGSGADAEADAALDALVRARPFGWRNTTTFPLCNLQLVFACKRELLQALLNLNSPLC